MTRMIEDYFFFFVLGNVKPNCDNFTMSGHLQGRDCRACPRFFFFFFFSISFNCRKLSGVVLYCCRFLRVLPPLRLDIDIHIILCLSAHFPFFCSTGVARFASSAISY